MHDNDCVDDLLLRDTDTDDPDLPELLRERRERLKYVTYTERPASADARFDLHLPGSAHRASASLPYLPDGARQESSRSALRVLSLEDDPATQEVFSLLLAPEEGFEVTCVSEVATCLACLRAPSAWSDAEPSTERLIQLPFDVLLLDVRLQGRHRGTEVFAAAQKDPGLQLPPTVICTALADRALATIVKDCGVGLRAYNVRVVLKPFNIETLTTELRSAARSCPAALAPAYRPGARGVELAAATKGTPQPVLSLTPGAALSTHSTAAVAPAVSASATSGGGRHGPGHRDAHQAAK
jgi:CheY-like chemotaxis protein